MTSDQSSLYEFVEMMKRKAPEYVDLVTAKTDADFEKAFDARLQRAVARLEADKKNYKELSEDGLSGFLAAALDMPGLSAWREMHSNGHVDLTIEADHCVPARKKLGEAKIYDGPAYHVKGLEQLLGRYTTGREGRGLLIVYVRKKDIKALVKKLRQEMDDKLPFDQQGQTADHLLKWSFLSVHAHSCGEHIEVGHIGCNLYTE